MYVCMCVCTYIGTYVCTYVCTYDTHTHATHTQCSDWSRARLYFA